MNKIGIISGGGKLPISIGKSLIKLNYPVIFLCIDKFCDFKQYKKYKHKIISINSLTKIINILKKNNVKKIIMVGNIKRPSIKDIKFDLKTLKLIKNFALDSSGDDKLLSTISFFFKNEGFPTFNWKKICKDLFADKDNLTKVRPSKLSLLNKDKGLFFFRTIGKADIAQSLIIQNKIILGIEASEGTDELIKRCFAYKKIGDKGVLVKLSKYSQNLNLDIPTIGLKTVQNLHKYNFEGAFLEKHKCLIIDKEKVINFCNQNNLFLSTVIKN